MLKKNEKGMNSAKKSDKLRKIKEKIKAGYKQTADA